MEKKEAMAKVEEILEAEAQEILEEEVMATITIKEEATIPNH